jgi:formate hydrogenlyase transcriptional activator
LQEREFERVGGFGNVKVNVRVIAATNRDLQQDVLEKKFRADLFFRLNIFPISIPSLRDRMDDLDALIAFFICKYANAAGKEITGISAGARQVLKSHFWPGNVRELEHTIERQIILQAGPLINEVTLFGQSPETEHTDCWSMRGAEREHIIKALQHCNWKIAGRGGTAQLLNLPPTTLASKMKKLNIERKSRAGDY